MCARAHDGIHLHAPPPQPHIPARLLQGPSTPGFACHASLLAARASRGWRPKCTRACACPRTCLRQACSATPPLLRAAAQDQQQHSLRRARQSCHHSRVRALPDWPGWCQPRCPTLHRLGSTGSGGRERPPRLVLKQRSGRASQSQCGRVAVWLCVCVRVCIATCHTYQGHATCCAVPCSAPAVPS